MAQGVYAEDVDVRYKAVKDIRKLLSKEHNPPIDEVINTGVVPRIVEILAGTDIPDIEGNDELRTKKESLQFEAAWVLTNIASGTSENTRFVVDSGAFPLFVQMLSHPNPELRGQCIWAIGNIAGESPQFRDATLNCDVMGPLLTTLVAEMNSGYHNFDLAKNTTWAVSNLCRGKPSPPWEQVAVALPILAQLIQEDEEDLVGEAAWAIAYMLDDSSRALEDVIRVGIVPRLVQLLSSRSYLVQAACVRALGNIVTGDDVQTQIVIDSGALSAFARLFTSNSRSILREACWAVSNITAGTPDQIRSVMEANLIPPIVHLLANEYLSIKREACWAICNATSAYETHPDIVRYLVNQGVIRPLCDILTVKDVKIIQVALDGLDNILAVGAQDALEAVDHENPYALHVEEAQGLATIFGLQQNLNMQIYLKAKDIIDKYFAEEDEEEQFVGSSFQFNETVPQGGFDFS